MLKRAFDLWFASLLLVVFLPIMLVISLGIWLVLGRPILYCQRRPGLHATPFTLLKFRTMTDMRDEYGNLLSDSERLIPLGRFLRATSLDELPELINVLRGEMSLIGPRPLLIEYLDWYTPEQARRHEVLPGITGWAQVNGRNALTWEQKLALDVWYVDNHSLWLDMKIIALTVWKVLTREGISQPGRDTMDKFRGDPSQVQH